MAAKRGHFEPTEKAYQSYMAESRNLIDTELSNLSSKARDLRLIRKMEYVLRSHGKRLRPTLVLLSAQNVGAQREDVMQLAIAIELLHTATLVHDDILDQDTFRRNALAVHAKWSVKDAILIGDALASLALNLAADYGRDISKIMSETCLLLCDGEQLDVDMMDEELSEKSYLERIKKKSASLFKAATQCGAITGGGSNREIECLAEFGENLGMAYQIKDDLSDMTPLRNRVPRDLRELRVTLPLVHLYETSKTLEKNRLLEKMKTLTSPGQPVGQVLWEKVQEKLEGCDSFGYCRGRINEYLAQSLDQVKYLRNNCYKSYLYRMAESQRPAPHHAIFSAQSIEQ